MEEAGSGPEGHCEAKGEGMSIISPHVQCYQSGAGQRWGGFRANYAIGPGAVFGRDLFERRETEELFLRQAKKCSRSEILIL